MTGFIFEGPDGSGKSFTALEVSRAVKIPIHHSGGPPKSQVEMILRVGKMLKMDNIIFDRFSIISEQVYGPILRGENIFEGDWLHKIPFPVIYCRPSRKTILETKLETKLHKTLELISKVEKDINLIIDAYDELMTHIKHIHFNRDKQTCAELISLLEKMK